MNRLVLRLVPLVALAPFVAGCASAEFLAAPGDTVIEDVTVIRGDGSPPLAAQSIVVRGERIAWTGNARKLDARAARRIALDNTYVMPGLIDMHAHVAIGPVNVDLANGTPVMRMDYDANLSRTFLAQLLDHGVTTIRNPAGPAEQAVALREAVARGTLRGPRIVTAGEVLDQGSFEGLASVVRTPDDVRAEVARQAALGVDIIKLYQTLTPELLRAGIDAAHAHELPAIGHLMMTDWTTAAELGIDGIVHMLPASPELLPAPRRAAYLGGITGTQMMFQWFEHADLAAPEIAKMLATLAAKRVPVDPTLVALESMFLADQEKVTANPALDTLPEPLLANWRNEFSITSGWSEDDFDTAHAAFEKALQLTGMMHDAGIPLLAGSDTSMPWVVPGDALHRELELLVEAGIPPLEVISIATRNGAAALGLDDQLGTVEAGKLADLVVLAADPLSDIRHTRKILYVFRNGEMVLDKGERQ